MKTQIFSYKGNLAATTDLDNGKFLNDPKGTGQLGCVVDVKEIQITKEAKNLIRKAKREGGSFAELMLTKYSNDDSASIGLLGFWKHHFGKDFCIGRDCELEVLDMCEEVDIEIPEEYKQFIDNEKEE